MYAKPWTAPHLWAHAQAVAQAQPEARARGGRARAGEEALQLQEQPLPEAVLRVLRQRPLLRRVSHALGSKTTPVLPNLEDQCCKMSDLSAERKCS